MNIQPANKHDAPEITFDEIFWNPEKINEVNGIKISKMLIDNIIAYKCGNEYIYLVSDGKNWFTFESMYLMVSENIVELSESEYFEMCNKLLGKFITSKAFLQNDRLKKYNRYKEIMQNLFWLEPQFN